MSLHCLLGKVFTVATAALALSVGFAGCGGSSGTSSDGGTSDTGTSLDAGTPSDGSTPSDSSTPVDATRPPDAGMSVDAGPPVDISGTITGGSVPAGAKVIVIWTVNTMGPVYQYKFGEGPATSSGFTVHFSGSPPVDAIDNLGGGLILGVGIMMLVPSGTNIPDGQLAMSFDPSTAIGASPMGAIVWTDGNFSGTGTTWPDAFSKLTLDCGTCMAADADAGMTFDSFTPTDCSNVAVQVGDPTTFSFCHWR